MKNWYQSKTIWVGILYALVGITEFIKDNPKVGVFAIANAAFIIILRIVTTAPINTPTNNQ